MTDLSETRPETRRRRKAERPQEILEAAFAEFSRNGYATTTLDQIAERAGVTKGTIYVYFENKEHLFISMVREITKATIETVQGMFENARGLDRRSVACAIQLHLPTHRRGQTAARSGSHADRRGAALSRNSRDRYHDEILRPCLDMLRQAIQRGVDRGEIRNSAIIDSPQVVIAPIALVDLWLMMFDDRQPLDLKAYFDAHLDMVLNGLLAK